MCLSKAASDAYRLPRDKFAVVGGTGLEWNSGGGAGVNWLMEQEGMEEFGGMEELGWMEEFGEMEELGGMEEHGKMEEHGGWRNA